MKLHQDKVYFALENFYQAEIEVFCNPGRLNEVEKFAEIENTIIRNSKQIMNQFSMTCKEALENRNCSKQICSILFRNFNRIL